MSETQPFLVHLKALSSTLLVDLAALCKDIDACRSAFSQNENEYRQYKSAIRRGKLLMEERRGRVEKSRQIRDAIVELRRFGFSNNAFQDHANIYYDRKTAGHICASLVENKQCTSKSKHNST